MSYGEEFDPYDMSPDDCVRLLDLMNNIVIDEISRAVEEDGSLLDVDKLAIMHMMIEEAGMPFDEIIRFCEIGEYIVLDRETRDMSEEEAAVWKYKREAVIAMIDTLLTSAAKSGVIDKNPLEEDPTVQMLEEIWKLP